MINTVTPETKSRINQKISDINDICMSIYDRKFDFSLVFKQIGTKAGTANLRFNIITLNPDYFSNGHMEDMINRTLPHEIAHLVAYQLFGDRGHGRGWKMVMRQFGLEPSRCHSYSLKGIKTRSRRTHEYSCKCSDLKHSVSMKMHSKIQSRPSNFSCRRCKSPLLFAGELSRV
jgi:SprT protein